MNKAISTARNFFTDKDGKIVITQAPNLPIIAWIVFSALAFLFKQGLMHQIVRFGAAGSLIVWASLEIKSGASPFRRVLGVIVLAFMIINLFMR